MVLEQIVVFMVDLGPYLVFTPLLATELEILAPSWAIFDLPTHLISIPAW
jgi:hypothetical protein